MSIVRMNALKKENQERIKNIGLENVLRQKLIGKPKLIKNA
jgi:hypothetical protein